MSDSHNSILVGKKLSDLLKQTRSLYKVGMALYDNIPDMNAMGYHAFDISEFGEVIMYKTSHREQTSIFKWSARILKETYMPDWDGKSDNLWNHYDIKDSDIEKWGNYVRDLYKRQAYRVEEWDSSMIYNVIMMERENTSRLGQSCMNDKPHYYDMLAGTPDLKIVVILDNRGVLLGRAFVWDANIGGINKVKFLDRFYTSRDYLDNAFIRYAKEKGYWYKRDYATYEHPKDWISPKGQHCSVIATVTLPNKKAPKLFPYMDTFHYGSKNLLSNSSSGAKHLYMSVFGTRDTVKNGQVVFKNIPF